MAANGQVDWYGNDLLLKLEQVSDEFLTHLAFQGEAEAKAAIQANGQIDTGFMLNSTYGLGPQGSHYGATWSAGAYPWRADRHEGVQGSGGGEKAGELNLEPHTAAIHAAAEYAVYQETRKPFLYRALERLQALAGGIIQEAGRTL